MKVVCIDNSSDTDIEKLNLTIYKHYSVIKELSGSYGILNDIGNVCYYKKDRFISTEARRNDLINRLYD